MPAARFSNGGAKYFRCASAIARYGAVPNHAASQRLGDRFKKSLL
jgi:hypothetical protein